MSPGGTTARVTSRRNASRLSGAALDAADVAAPGRRKRWHQSRPATLNARPPQLQKELVAEPDSEDERGDLFAEPFAGGSSGLHSAGEPRGGLAMQPARRELPAAQDQ